VQLLNSINCLSLVNKIIPSSLLRSQSQQDVAKLTRFDSNAGEGNINTRSISMDAAERVEHNEYAIFQLLVAVRRSSNALRV
jgi:hypothetical protein